MLLTVQVAQGIMIARDKDNFALEEIMKEEKYLFASLQFFLFIMIFVIVIAVDDISPHKAVVEVKRVGSDGFGKFLELVSIIVDVCDEDDVEF